jgi:hypothetical protein
MYQYTTEPDELPTLSGSEILRRRMKEGGRILLTAAKSPNDEARLADGRQSLVRAVYHSQYRVCLFT